MSPNSCASVVRKTSFKAEIYIKLAASHHQRCASSYRFRSGRTRANNNIAWATNLTSDGLRTFSYDANNRLAQVQVGDADEASKVTYLHNAAGQRVFKSEPRVAQTAPSEARLGGDFITWLKKNFGWLFAQAQQDATLGQSYVYADPSTGSGQAGLQSYNLLGEYGNGGSNSAGRMEYIYLPTETGAAQLIGLYKNNRFYAVHTDHLGTPRQINDDMNKVVWQWAYSAFGDNQPTGVLTATTNPKAALTNQPTLLQATSPRLAVNLRYPGQYWDEESKLSYNINRNYQANQGRYTQPDPIGLEGGWSRFGYVGGNPLWAIDPFGLDDFPVAFDRGSGTLWVVPPGSSSAEGFPAANNTTSTSRGPWAPGTYKYGYSTLHKDDAPGSSYGSNGNAVFNVPGCVGCGVHSGREGKQDRKGGSGVQHVTEGCIRTTDDATKLIQDLIRQGHRPVLEVSQ
jgi:RHS repeat-associated protein